MGASLQNPRGRLTRYLKIGDHGGRADREDMELAQAYEVLPVMFMGYPLCSCIFFLVRKKYLVRACNWSLAVSFEIALNESSLIFSIMLVESLVVCDIT